MIFFTFIKEAWTLAKKKAAERNEIEKRRGIAKAFNNYFCDTNPYKKEAGWLPRTGSEESNDRSYIHTGYAWMCPDCNQIHLASSWSVFSGLQYPACCSFPEGHRLFKDWQ